MKSLLGFLDNKILFNSLTTLRTKYLFYKTKKFLDNYPYFFIFSKNNKKNLLENLFDKYGSDKGSSNKDHFYASYYHEIFNKKKEEIKLIFECGIGTTDINLHSNMGVNGTPGASLRVYRDYFKNAQIYAGDIDKKILFSSDRINTYYVDQLDASSINKMWNNINIDGFDIIIDDAMHTLSASNNFFLNSFSKLKKKGLYIIEDVHTAYLVDLVKKLNSYRPKIIAITNKNNIDDYLLIIKKL
mgnify:CR=1 FL=1